jgi:hypothetical protein
LRANPADPRVRLAAAYAFSRQREDGSWSYNGRKDGSIPCLTANIGRALARLGYADDERVIKALGYCASLYARLGCLDCVGARDFSLNGYCHMLTPKMLLFIGRVPGPLWPEGTDALRIACVEALRDKQVFRSLPAEAAEYQKLVAKTKAAQRAEVRQRFLDEHQPLAYGDKPGWLRFGFPLSYNSDALEALLALCSAAEKRRSEYEPAIQAVVAAADDEMRWNLRTSLNGKMLADVEAKGRPSKWLTLRALRALAWAGPDAPA